MTKITIGVYKSFKNSGKRNHRNKTKKEWCHYFIDSVSETFGTEWVSAIKAIRLKLKIHKVRKALCLDCGLYFTGVIRKESDSAKCPNCD